MKLSIIIVSYNNYNDLHNCIESIHKFNDMGDLMEIIVVDNSPNDELFNHFKVSHPEVRIVKNPINGFGRGNNIGFKHSNGEILLFLNPDTILIESIFEDVYDKFDSNGNLGACGIKLVNRDLNPNLSFYWIEKYGVLSNIAIKYYNKRNKFKHGSMFISGACMFMRREVFSSIGMFDENVFMYNEEIDLFRRMIASNYDTDYFPDFKLIHLEGKTTNNHLLSFEQRVISSIYLTKKYRLNFSKQYKREKFLLQLKCIVMKDINTNKRKIKFLKNAYKNYLEEMNKS